MNASSLFNIENFAEGLGITFSSTLQNVDKAAQTACTFAKQHLKDFDDFNLKIVLFESLTNAVKHGNKLNPALTVDLRIEIKNEKFEITVTDQGNGFVPIPITIPQNPTGENTIIPTTGRGLSLTAHYCESVTRNPKGNATHFTLRIPNN